MKKIFGLVIVLLPLLAQSQESTKDNVVSASEVIATIIEKTGTPLIPNTVDIIKEGDPATPIKGIVTCMFATMEVLKKAVENNCNLVIAHEPLYYNHLDQTEKLQQDSVYLKKKKFILDHGLVVWRFHDYIHSIQPDAIMTGMIEKLGWQRYQAKDNPYKFIFPEMTLTVLLKNLKKTFPKPRFNVVGDPEMKLASIAYIPGASGSEAHMEALRNLQTDVVIAGEVPQWETYEYVRDAIEQGEKKAIIFIGHINSEESGMRYCADWLKGFIKDVPIYFIASGSSYWTY